MLLALLCNSRLTFEATKRSTTFPTNTNRMTPTPSGTKLGCLYRDITLLLYERAWDLRISYPTKDIITHANDVKSCFKQMKLYPNIMPASFIVVTDFM